MPKIDKHEYRKRLDRITELFSGMVSQADEMSRHRCPYRDRHDQCTAAFRCRNQRPPAEAGNLALCGHDGKFDYRSAWESAPSAYGRAKARIERVRDEAAKRRADDPEPDERE